MIKKKYDRGKTQIFFPLTTCGVVAKIFMTFKTLSGT